jgi:pimeloyl-ACP methyl ester carboxylesterase
MRAATSGSMVRVNGVDLHVLEAGEGPAVLLCHGFPELAYSWRHQLPALAEAGYRAIAPDQRGYGRSSRPPEVTDYDLAHLCGDMVALLDALGCERAVVVGHDWGAGVAWALAQRHPDRFAGVVGMSVPFVPRSHYPPTEAMRHLFAGRFFYILYFQEPGVADADLAADPATTMRRFLAGASTNGKTNLADLFAGDGRGLVERLPEPEGLPDWLSPEELDHYVTEFSRTGFTGGLNWYRNLDRNWAESALLANSKIEIPALFVAGSADPVLAMMPPSVMDGWLTDPRGTMLVEGAGHWVQQEKPAEVNAALLSFLRELQW